jgi:hypothetical protein
MSYPHPDPGAIAATFTISPDDVLARAFDPRVYPHQHLVIQKTTSRGSPHTLVPTMIASVELLAPGGWELVSFGQVADRTLIAVMRRTPV